MDDHPSPSPGHGAGHCSAGSLEGLRTTHCPDGLSEHQSWAVCTGWEPAIRPQRLCAVSVLSIGVALSGCRCIQSGYAAALVLFPSQSHWLCLLCWQNPEVSGSRKRIRKWRWTQEGVRKAKQSCPCGLAGSSSSLCLGASIYPHFQRTMKADGGLGPQHGDKMQRETTGKCAHCTFLLLRTDSDASFTAAKVVGRFQNPL